MSKVRSYKHKFKEVVTDKFVVRLSDKREQMPKAAITIELSGEFRQQASLSVSDARELEKAIHIILRRVRNDL